jgi:hypothetical protein
LSERSGKACGHKPDTYAVEKSDIGVVPKKEPNNVAGGNGGGSGGKAGDRGKFWKDRLRLARRGRGKH